MALQQLKFDPADFAGQDITSLPDAPSAAGFTAAELKARFDNIGKVMLAMGAYNALIDALTSCEEGAAGAADIGAQPIDGLSGTTVQDLLISLKNYIDNRITAIGAVTSVNGKTGDVVLSADDVGAAGPSVVMTVDVPRSGWIASDGGYVQSVAASGVTASSNQIVSPDAMSHSAYCEAGVYCSGQATGLLAFKARQIPGQDLSVNVLIAG